MSLTKSFYASVAGLLVAQNTFANNAANVFDQGNKAAKLQLGTGTNAADAVANIIRNLLTLVTIIAVAYVLYAGFQIMTAGGDEERVKKGRQTIIYVIVGIIVMWLAYWIVNLIITSLV